MPVLKTLHLVLAALFACCFAYTFIGQQRIETYAQDYVSLKTEQLVTPAIDATEKALQTDLAQKLLTPTQVVMIETEIASFRTNPKDYILNVTATPPVPTPEDSTPTLRSTADRALAAMKKKTLPLSDKIAAIKEHIHSHYQNTLQALLLDLRIFSGTNVLAAGLACFLAHRSQNRPSRPLVLITLFLTAALVLSIWSYLDSLSFLSILLNSYLGWYYPITVAGLFFLFYLHHPDSLRRKAA